MNTVTVLVRQLRALTALGGAALTLAACVGGGDRVPPRSANLPPRTSIPPRVGAPTTPLPPIATATTGGATARSAGVVRGPAIETLPLDAGQAARAFTAFRISCPALLRRTDGSGLTAPADWQPACAAAATERDGVTFFRRWFEAAQVGDGRAFATGYYIPEIDGDRVQRPGYAPIYARPLDLIDVDLGAFSADLAGKKIRGRVQGTNFVPFDDRTAIEQGSLEGRARIIGWAADPVELFFLQVQGSGLVRLPGGDVLRIGYDSQNGRDYTGIGKLMRDRGLLGPDQQSMQGIVAWLHAHPDEGRAVMRENKSFVFFRLLDGAPVGALSVPVTGGATVAADPKFVPLGAPVLLSMDRADANGVWIAQDTGGAIKGSNRFDTFWGAGDDARAVAGGMSARGTAFVLLPRGVLDRIAGGTSNAGTPARP